MNKNKKKKIKMKVILKADKILMLQAEGAC